MSWNERGNEFYILFWPSIFKISGRNITTLLFVASQEFGQFLMRSYLMLWGRT